MADTLLFALPEKPARDRRDTHWWHVVDGELVSEGQGDEWLNFAGPRRNLIGIAPAAQVRLSFSEKVSATTTDRQANTAAATSRPATQPATRQAPAKESAFSSAKTQGGGNFERAASARGNASAGSRQVSGGARRR